MAPAQHSCWDEGRWGPHKCRVSPPSGTQSPQMGHGSEPELVLGCCPVQWGQAAIGSPFVNWGGCARARVPTELSHSGGEASMCVFQLGLLRAFEGLSLLPCPAM